MDSYDITPKDRVVVVTGSAQGIGKKIAQAFAEEGSTVIIADINNEQGKETEEGFQRAGLKTFYIHTDLSIKGQPQALIENVAQRWGRIDVLVNNVRAGKKTTFKEDDEENWDNSFNIMVRASFFASREAIGIMKTQGGGSIINIGSILSRFTISSSPAYQIAKAGLAQVTRYLALEGGKHGIRVNTVSPGLIIRDEHRERFNEDGNEWYRSIAMGSVMTRDVGESRDVAETILFLADPKNKFITGQEFIVDGGSSIREHFDLLYENAQEQTVIK